MFSLSVYICAHHLVIVGSLYIYILKYSKAGTRMKELKSINRQNSITQHIIHTKNKVSKSEVMTHIPTAESSIIIKMLSSTDGN